MRVAVYCGSKAGNDPAFTEGAAALGKLIGSRGWTLVYGGAVQGLMGTVADAVLKAGGEVIGVMTEMPEILERRHPGLKNCEVVPDLNARKARMMQLADAYIALPGGPGTLDEISDVISLARLKVDEKPVILFNIRDYYEPLRAVLRAMTEAAFITEEEIDGVFFLRELEQVAQALEMPLREFKKSLKK